MKQSQYLAATGEIRAADSLENPHVTHHQATFPFLYIPKPTTLMLWSSHYTMALTEICKDYITAKPWREQKMAQISPFLGIKWRYNDNGQSINENKTNTDTFKNPQNSIKCLLQGLPTFGFCKKHWTRWSLVFLPTWYSIMSYLRDSASWGLLVEVFLHFF